MSVDFFLYILGYSLHLDEIQSGLPRMSGIKMPAVEWLDGTTAKITIPEKPTLTGEKL